ncbi:MAG: SCP2 sterol-binding domain-containing protein [Oscillospiraceae bacterium]|nr:SCP2 sterol-binding domain-containing protein [Oscillospiraceae bacterium]
MATSKKSAANETAKEITAAATAETAAPAEKTAAPEVKAPEKKTAKTAAEPAAESKTEKKRSCGRKPAAKKAATSSAAETKSEEKPAAKRTRKTKTVAPEQTDFDKFVSDVKKKTEKAKAPFNFAAQVAIIGKVDGIFYIKSEDGKVFAEGYDYNNADLYVTADSETFAAVMNGKADFDSAVLDGKISFENAPINTVIAFKKVVF